MSVDLKNAASEIMLFGSKERPSAREGEKRRLMIITKKIA